VDLLAPQSQFDIGESFDQHRYWCTAVLGSLRRLDVHAYRR
jgi:hypothetical protein